MSSNLLRLLGLILSAMLGACASTPTDSAAWPLEGTHWTLVSLAGQPVSAMPSTPERTPFLRMQAAARRVSGYGGCNRITGAYTLDGASLRFGSAAGTRMACPTGGDTEAAFLSMMGAVAGWRAAGERLQLVDGGQAVLAEFVSGSKRLQCAAGQTVLVHYESGDSQHARAWLAFDGREYAMRSAPTASGARYVAQPGREPGTVLEWSTKDAGGMLREVAADRSNDAQAWRTIATCVAAP
jgi:heat shock protein HslJ